MKEPVIVGAVGAQSPDEPCTVFGDTLDMRFASLRGAPDPLILENNQTGLVAVLKEAITAQACYLRDPERSGMCHGDGWDEACIAVSVLKKIHEAHKHIVCYCPRDRAPRTLPVVSDAAREFIERWIKSPTTPCGIEPQTLCSL